MSQQPGILTDDRNRIERSRRTQAPHSRDAAQGLEAGGRNGSRHTERHETIVIGGGQAGLAVGYHLARRGLSFVILDAGDRVGDVWRNRWDSLRLFTPAKFAGLDGMPFPADRDRFPTKDEMGDYLESYAERFDLPVRTGVEVDGLSKDGDRFVVTAGDLRFEADNVVVAMSNYQKPRVPEFGRDLDRSILQMHSIDYRNPSQLREGRVLIVGAGNSGSEIGMELSRSGHEVWMSGRDTGEIPFRIDGVAGRYALVRLVLGFLYHKVLTVDTPIGRKVRPKILSMAGPLVRVKARDMAAAGIERVPKTDGTRDGLPLLADGRVLDVENVIWCTGFHSGFSSWIDLPVLAENGYPRHERGVAVGVPGLYFVGLHFLYALSSALIRGVSRDAERMAEAIAIKRHKAAA